jgi:hypothetical protein
LDVDDVSHGALIEIPDFEMPYCGGRRHIRILPTERRSTNSKRKLAALNNEIGRIEVVVHSLAVAFEITFHS